MNVLIVEDEKIFANNLELLLKEIDDSINILAKTGSVKNTIEWLKNYTCDLIFMDIHLSDGICFEIFDNIKTDIPVVFITSFNQYAIKAFKVNSIDYLLKPINTEELKQSLSKFRKLTSFAPSHNLSEIFKNILNKEQEYKQRFIVNIADKLFTINCVDIAYFYVLEKGIFCCTFPEKNYPMDQTLDKIELQLDPEKFFRVNRQFIININAIKAMSTLSRGRILVSLQPKAPEDVFVSLSRINSFKQWLDK